MRQTIRDVLLAETDLTDIVPVSRWFQAGRVLDRPAKPFVVLRWLAPVSSGAAYGRYMEQLRVDVHDERGSYARIDAVLGTPDTGSGVYGVLSGLQQHVGADARIAQCDYLGHSGDQEDPNYMTNYRFNSWRVIGVHL